MRLPGYDPTTIPLPLPPRRIHFVGVGGVGVSGLARIALKAGYAVSGSDVSASTTTDELEQLGARITIGHSGVNVRDAALVVATAAARDDNPELIAAHHAGLPVIKRAAMLGRLALERTCLAVAGTHGKSTTSGMATLALTRAGLDPSFAVGANVIELGANADVGAGRHFVVEADEYDYSFLWLRPDVAIVTNIEHDHPDLYPDLPAVLDAFERFASVIHPGGALVVSADDPGCIALMERVAGRLPCTIVTFGERGVDWRLNREGGGSASAVGPRAQTFALRLAVPGRHNQMNALAVIAAAESLEVDPAALLPGLQEFRGVARRFQVLLDVPELTVIDDYAHHPTEIAATIAAARGRYSGRRLLVVFQPHTFTRTRALLSKFASALDAADLVILAEIYGSRETDDLGISAADVAARMTRTPILATDPADATRAASEEIRAGDVVLVMGAGDITLAAYQVAGGWPQ